MSEQVSDAMKRYEQNPTLENLIKVPEAERVLPSRDSRIAQAEWEVVEAAIKWREQMNYSDAPTGELAAKVDNLVALREEVEKTR